MLKKNRLQFSKTIMLYITFALCALCCGNVLGGALSFGLFVGAVYSANPFIPLLIYLAASGVFGLQSLFHAGVRAAVLLLFVMLHKLIKRKIRGWLLLLYLIAANVFYCVYKTADYFQLFDKLLYSACGIAFAFVCIYVFRAVFIRGLSYPPALDEKICIALYIIAVSYGASGFSFSNLQLIYFVAPFTLLFICIVFGDKTALISAVLLGLGNLLRTGEFAMAVFCATSAVAVIATMRLNRFVAGLSVLIADVLFAYFFNLHGTFGVLVFVPTICSVAVFFSVPASVYGNLRDSFSGNAEKYLGKSVVKKMGMLTAKKLYRLSDIFLSMKNAFFAMSVGGLTEDCAQNAIVKQCSETVCRDCPERSHCWRNNIAETENSLLQIARCAVKRGKCTILDVPQTLSLKCARVSTLLAEINIQSAAYRNYADRVEQSNSGKLLLGEQLGGVSTLLNKIAGECKSKITYNTNKEQELVETLIFHNILCCGAVVMEQDQSLNAILTVAQKDLDRSAIEQIVTKQLVGQMQITKVEETDSPTWLNVYLAPKPRFEVSFGVAAVSKDGNEVSGDTHSVVKTDNSKCIIALCDGMGSGPKAEQMSTTAIGLVEDFYRAGFDNDTVLSCVNRLLVGNGNEVFCAVDICVLDMTNGFADFIKLGAPVGFVKSEGVTELINGSGLPLGVLEEMKPSVTKKTLSSGDTVMVVSDGITDCFGDNNAIAGILHSTSCTNPQSIAEMVMARALKQCSNKPKDDMTVLVARIS